MLKLIIFLSFCLAFVCPQPYTPASEVNALTQLYYSTGGPWWNQQSGWASSSPTVCGWFGVECVMDGPVAHVGSLSLSSNNLVGTIPPAFGNLPFVSSIDLSCNSLNGSLPVQIGNLTSISTINIAFNQLSGPLPNGAFAQLTYLQTLNGSNNMFESPIPPILQRIRNVALYGNSFGCDRDAWMYRFTNVCPADKAYITVLFQLIGYVLLSCTCLTLFCLLLSYVFTRHTLLTDPALPDYTPDQLTDVACERGGSKKKKRKSMGVGRLRNQRFTLPRFVGRPLSVISADQGSYRAPTPSEGDSEIEEGEPKDRKTSGSVHYVGFAEYGLRP